MIRTLISFVILILFIGCGPAFIKPDTIAHYAMETKVEQQGDSLAVFIKNDCHSPVGIKVSSPDLTKSTMIIEPFGKLDTSIVLEPSGWTMDSVKVNVFLSAKQIPDTPMVALPFPKGLRYKIIQGYNSSYSHNRPTSRNAIDFSLAIGDTICAAADGYVVEMVEGYINGGGDRRYRPYANFITLYHPALGIYTRYAHLMHQGSFVAIGDTVQLGESIALSGLTGYTDVSHLHFTAMGQRGNTKLVSIPTKFTNGTEGKDFKNGKRVRH